LVKITNTGTTDIDIIEFIEKQTTLSPGASLEIDSATKKLKIGDIEIILS